MTEAPLLAKFKEALNHCGVSKGRTVLVACSGGMDSTVLAHLFFQSGISFAIAHVQFGLRGPDSELDEESVANMASQFNVPLFRADMRSSIQHLQTDSVQMKARDLRYQWLEELRITRGFHFVALGHHKDDQAETVLLRIIRGEGPSSLQAMKPVHKSRIRPLLSFTKEELENWARGNGLMWREDKSNTDLKYVRNRIRLQVIPLLRELNPSVRDNLSELASRQVMYNTIYRKGLEKFNSQIINSENEQRQFAILKLARSGVASTLLYEWLFPLGFSAGLINQIASEFEHAGAGATWLTSEWTLLKGRKHLILFNNSNRHAEDAFQPVLIPKERKRFSTAYGRFKMELLPKKLSLPSDKYSALLDGGKLDFPLVLRRWKKGDYFYPQGLNKKKKIKDFLTDIKVSIASKKNVLVLLSGDKIVWVIGYRTDHRYGISSSTREFYKITCLR